MKMLCLTHITQNSCHTYLLKNTYDEINEWYTQYIGQSISIEFWNDICKNCPTNCSRSDDDNNIIVTYMTF